MRYEIWDTDDEQIVLLPFPGQKLGDVDTSSDDWTLIASFNAVSELDAHLTFKAYLVGITTPIELRN